MLTFLLSEAFAATIAERVAEYGDGARARLLPSFERASIAYPPAQMTFVVIKDADRLEVWAGGGAGPQVFVRDYPILAASGVAGPKLRRGDRQVPEGIYTIDGLNPDSSFHLSLHVDYPNAFDRMHAAADGRTDPGSAISIHGNAVSIGCLAMGDPAIEELFVLVAETGLPVPILIAPTDFRLHPDAPLPAAPAWAPELYGPLVRALGGFVRTGPVTAP